MKDLARLAIDTAHARGASYADARAIEYTREDIQVKNGEVGGLDLSSSAGIGVRVLVQGAWGFSATDDLTKEGVERCAASAVSIGRASASLEHDDVRLAPEPAHRAVWASQCAIDPFQVSLETKLGLLFRIDSEMRAVRGVKNAESFLSFQRKHQYFLSTEGSDIEQTLTRSGGGFSATAVSADDVQRRSFPQAEGFHQALGYELIEGTPYVEHARRVAEEAVALLTAEQCPAGERDLILEGSQLALQIHESVGHPTELDRVLGMEANYAGTSFLTLEKQGKLQFGSKLVNLVADATLPHALGTFAYDDDGVEAQRWHIVQDGLFLGYLTSRELAHRVGESRSKGCVRSDGWFHIPMIRMVNLSLMAGSGSLEDLLSDTDHGIYMETNRSWSIDQLRYNFQFKTEIAWEIRKGKRVRMLKNPTYQGITTGFWNSCDSICGPEEWKPWGVVNCGKGQPGQVGEITHGAAPARFRKVRVGVGYED
ncbi:MAG: TldD/PmbA family protein [Candidatus Eisenbacteria bacterium]|uniref:TldD/PmbA family protein n=1 Tax=Eiseniibacteriota bacterium TaxID=2212470 RepID=A0A538T0E3_UNCEI|nr:MAG: TldD/PmbA family protein [Candidatus Eisenbacteria bacterium]